MGLRSQLPASIVAALGAWFGWRLQLLPGDASFWQWGSLLGGTFLAALLVGLGVDFLMARRSRLLLRAENYLYSIAQDCAHSRHEEMKSADFGPYLNAVEVPLGKGDSITILTHDLDAYDAIDLAAEIIARNIVEGCRYEYLIPDSEFIVDQFRRYHQKIRTLIASSGRRSPEDLDAMLRRGLRHRIVGSSAALYYFSYIERNSKTHAYWYMTTPSADDPPSGKVFYTELGEKNKERLYAAFELIRKASHEKKRGLVSRLRDAWGVILDRNVA